MSQQFQPPWPPQGQQPPMQQNTQYPPQGQPWPSTPQQQSFYQPPPKKKARRGLWIVLLSIFVFLLVGYGAMMLWQIATEPSSWHTIQHFSGSGTQNTATFTVGDRWKLKWNCDPTSFPSGQYNIIVSMYGAKSTPFAIVLNTMCQDGNASGSTEQYRSGTIHLMVTSEAVWTLQVQEPG